MELEGVYVLNSGTSTSIDGVVEEQRETRYFKGVQISVFLVLLVVLACSVAQSFIKGGWMVVVSHATPTSRGLVKSGAMFWACGLSTTYYASLLHAHAIPGENSYQYCNSYCMQPEQLQATFHS